MILRRYIVHEILRPMVLIALVLMVIFASFSSANYLADAAHGLLTGTTVVSLTALKTLIGLEALLPTALYLAVIIGLGRLYNDSEMTALAAAGISELQVLKIVARLVIVMAVLVAALTLYIRPWAYNLAYHLEARALAELDIDKLEGGRFYRLDRPTTYSSPPASTATRTGWWTCSSAAVPPKAPASSVPARPAWPPHGTAARP